MNDRKAVIIFIMLSIVLLFGLSLLPQSPVIITTLKGSKGTNLRLS